MSALDRLKCHVCGKLRCVASSGCQWTHHRLDKLHGDIQAATSTAQIKRLEKERAKLEKQQVELIAFDEKLRHYADRRITLDLDDGVKVNYGKFGDLLTEVKAVHGKKAEDV